MSNIVLTLTASDAQFVQKMMQARAEAEKLGYTVELLDGKGKKAGQGLGQMLSGTTASLARAAAGFAGVGSAIAGIATAARMIMAEYEQIKQRRSEAAGAHVRLADTEAQLLQALGTGKDAMSLEAAKRILQKTRTYGTDMAVLQAAAAGALSGRGTGITERQSLEAVHAAAGMSAATVDQSQLLSLASGVQELRKGFGGSAKAQGGYAIAGAALHRSPDIASFTQFAAPMAAQIGQNYGMSERDALAGISTLSNLMGDSEGRMSTTAFNQTVKQVYEATAGVKELKDASIMERFRWLRESQSKEAKMIRTRLLGYSLKAYKGEPRQLIRDREKAKRAGFDINEFSGESRAQLAAESLFNPDSKLEGWKAWQEGAKTIPGSDAEAESLYDSKQKQLRESGVQQAARMQGILRGATEEAHLKNPGEAIRGVMIEQLPNLLRAMGQTALAAKVQGLSRNLAKGVSVDDAFTEIDQELRGLQKSTATPFFRRLLRTWDNPGMVQPRVNIPSDPTQDPSNLPDYLNEDELGRIKQIQEMRRQLHDIRQQQVPTGPSPTPNQSSSRQRIDLRQQLVITDPYGRSLNRNFNRSHPARALSS